MVTLEAAASPPRKNIIHDRTRARKNSHGRESASIRGVTKLTRLAAKVGKRQKKLDKAIAQLTQATERQRHAQALNGKTDAAASVAQVGLTS
jgi:hypothetical protein